MVHAPAMSEDAAKALASAEKLYKRLVARRPEIAEFDAYFRGVHPLKFASREWRAEHQERFEGFSDNWCGVVGRAPAERTEIFGFQIGEDGEVLSDDERELWRDWEINEGPAQASQGFLTSTIAKRSAVYVWGTSDDEPVVTWEHPSQVLVDYDPAVPRIRRAAIKAWFDEDAEVERLMYQTPTSVWKWFRPMVAGQVVNGRTAGGLYVSGGSPFGGGGWQPYVAPEDPTWPLPNPFGRVSIVEFQNRPMLAGEPLSDIAGTMAMQNAINLLWAYLFSAADWASMPARVVMGQEPPKIPILNEQGQKVGEEPVDQEALKRGRLLWLTGQKTTIGQWESAKLDVFTDVVNIGVRHVSAQTSTPIYLVHGELGNVNGETMTALDGPLNGKVREGHKFYTASVREVFSLMALARNKSAVAEKCRTGHVQWKNPELRSDAQISDAALKDVQVGWPFAAVLEQRYGRSQPEIDRILAMRDKEQSDPYLAIVNAKDSAKVSTGADAEPAPVG